MTLQAFTNLLAVVGTDPPAGGAAIKEVIIATLMGGVAFGGVVFLALGHRNGRITWLQKAGEFMGRQTGLPAWAALPLTVLTASLVSAVFGLYWDISLHLSKGRDPGPLANPSHYFILIGLLGCFSAGVFALTMPKPGTRPSPWAVRLADGWYAPVGGILIAVSSAFGLIGFPLDDVWHRIFGQDVTLWGPTHLLMLTGAGLNLIGASVLLTEGSLAADRVRGDRNLTGREKFIRTGRRAMAAGGLLAALSIYQGEIDYGIMQFQLLFAPILFMVAAGVALTYARITGGKGGAILAVLFFLFVRAALLLVVSGLFDRPVAHFPIYLGAAVAVEIVGIFMAGSIYQHPMRFATVAGIGIGTLGLATEWWWSHVWSLFPWTASMFPKGALFGFVAAICGSLIGAWMANSLMLRPRVTGAMRFAPLAALLAIMAMAGYGLHQKTMHGLTATMYNTPAQTGKPGKWVNTTVKLNTTYFDSGAEWTNALAWQGPGFVVSKLVRTGPGTFKTTEPLPAFGKWKSVVRFHKGSTMEAAPVFQPLDLAIPKPEVPASPVVTREMHPDRVILQREAKFDGGWLPMLGYFLMLAIALSLIAALAWGIQRVSTPKTDEQQDEGGGAEETATATPRKTGPQPSSTPRAI